MKPVADQAPLLRFPCDFPIKIMGPRAEGFAQTVVDIVLRHAPDFRPETVEMRASGSGNYLSVTCTVRAASRQQLDELYRELSAHPAVKIVL
jgi:putative lipoic acid-binding regulatory protein